LKMTLSKLFDTDVIVKRFNDAKVTGIDDFVSSISSLSDQVITVLRNNVSLADNIDCRVKTLELKHDTSYTFENPLRLKTVQHIVGTRVIPFANPLTSLAWQYNAKGDIEIKAQFLGAPTAPVSLTFVMYF